MSSPSPVKLSADDTSLVAAQANQLASSTAMTAQLNSNLAAIYLTSFNSWCANVNSGRISNTNPPRPPVQYVVSGPDKQGFQWPVLDPAGAPVCGMPPIPADCSKPAGAGSGAPNTIDVGPNIGGKWFSVGNDDTFQSGMTTPPIPDASGAMHTYEKYAAPVGSGWYLQVS